MATTRIQNNQITDSTITYAKIASGTLIGSNFNANLTLNSNVSIVGNLSVSGNTTTVNSTDTYINDPVVVFNNGYAGSLTGYDIGILVNRNLTSLTSYGGVNTFFGWVEADSAFSTFTTTATGAVGTSQQNLNNSGYANIKAGNIFAQSGTVTATNIYAATIGNSGSVLNGTLSATNVSGTVATANATIYTGVTNTSTGTYYPVLSAQNTTGNAQSAVNSSLSYNAATGALTATSFAGTLSATNVSGTVATANVSLYDSVTAYTTTANFFPQFSNISTTGNTITGVATNMVFNPGTGNLYAGAFVGSGIYLTGVASASAGNTAFYACTTPYTTSQTFYPLFSNINTAGNTTYGVAGNLSFNPGTGNLTAGNIAIVGNTISSLNGTILGLGAIGSVSITGGTSGYTVITNGAGVLTFNPGNALVLGANATGQLVSNAVTLTSTTNVTDAIAQLNQILGKLTPPSPINFPGNVASSLSAASTFSITTGTTSAIMTGDAARGTGWTQMNNIAGNTYQLAGGTTFSAVRANTIATSTLAAIKSGTGNVRSWYGGNIITGFVNLTGSLGTVTNGNLTITNDTDYHNIIASVAAGFWNSANVSLSASAGMLPGWNSILIEDLGGYTTGNTNTLMWYNDISLSAAGTPTFSNTSAALTTNVVTYSSSIPHFTSGAIFRLKGNVNNLSGDTYPTGNVNLTSATAAAGGFQAPTAVPYTAAVASAGYWSGTVPLPRYLCNTTYGSGTSAYYETNASILATGFGNSTLGPTLTVTNGYTASAATAHSPSATILWKNGTGTAIDETTIAATTPIGAVSGGMYRIIYSQSTDTPVAVTGSETVWNSTTTPLGLMDATVTGWASPTSGVIRCDQTNYSTGYLPVGPNLTAQNSTQYFTVRFAQSGVTNFYLNYTGIAANIFCAMPTSAGVGGTNATNVSNATWNGWLTAAISNPGGVPGNGSAGNGFAGCVTGAVPSFNTPVVTGTGSGKMQISFGTTSSTGAVGNYIYIRFKLTAGQYISALSLTAT